MKTKTNLSIQPGGRGYQVVGKYSSSVYTNGSKFHCTWAISNNPEWKHEENQKKEEMDLNDQAMREMIEAQEKA